MISRFLIGILFLCIVSVSLCSRVLEIGNGIFPFGSWDLFSEFSRYGTGLTFEITKDGHTCAFEDCSLFDRNLQNIVSLWAVAAEFAKNPKPENALFRQMESMLFLIIGSRVEYKLLSYEVDLKTNERNPVTMQVVYASPGAP